MTSKTQIEPNASKIKNFGVPLFAVNMGLAGATLMYLRAAYVLGYPMFIAYVLAAISIGVFVLITVSYSIKFIKYKDAVIEELNHPVKSVFFGAVAVSFLLVATILVKLHLPFAHFTWWIGTGLELAVTCYSLSFWINSDMQLQHATPAWMIPIVGNLIVPFAGVDIVGTPVLMFFFSIGVFFWITLIPMLINRIIFHGPIAEHFLPTLFILIAPPAAGLIAYLNVNGGTVDFFGAMLYNVALFFTLLLVLMYKKFIGMKFFISCWAFIFPLAAMTVATQIMYAQFGLGFYNVLSHILIMATTVLLAIVSYHTIKSALNGALYQG